MKSSSAIDIIIFLLILLFVYTASSKLMDFEHFKIQMNKQTIPQWTAQVLIYTLPAIEIITSLLLLYKPTRCLGLIIALILLTMFTCYVGLVLTYYFGRIPCSCGGVLKIMGWKVHFIFNIFFLLLTVLGLYMVLGERRAARQDH